ncbi:hypothetical protein GCM10007036_34930 [Alsobacter metallidurans]|uniref:Blue-light-activated histidine kinase n=1 Tax=Alsobacter metallidurans TaxID=340221 RepID=A0A917I9T0_9HYPH|nr:PAS domain-containing protein [Alsobacter metallidurans]GGH26824.1 hypothetical protein GCM10007036_34930 [Alsobacter metallidurans]
MLHRGVTVAALAVALLAAAVLAAALAVFNTDRIVTLNMAAAQVREHAFRLDASYCDVLAAEYGLLISDDPAARERFRSLLPAPDKHLAKLFEAVRDDEQRKRLESIRDAMRLQVTEAERLLGLVEAGKRDEAVTSARGSAPGFDHDAVRAEIVRFLDHNRVLMLRSERGYRNAARTQMAIGGIAALGILLFGAHQIFSTYRFLRVVDDSRKGLSKANERLEEEVAARTRELAGAVQRFQVALRAANVIVFAQDLNRVFTWVSGDLFGKSPESIRGLREEDFLPDDVVRIAVAAKDEVLANGAPRDHQYSVEINGERRWYRVRTEPLLGENGAAIGLIGAIIDLTSEKLVQQRLAQVSVELQSTILRFQVALKGADITVFTQGRDLAYTWVSSDFEGRAAAEFVGKTDPDIFKPELARKLTELKGGVLVSGDPASGEFRVERPGAEKWHLLRVEAQRDEAGAIVGVVGASVDVTERRQRETHNRILLRELTHRTKNLLAVVQAMARQTLTTSVSARDFEARFSGRLQGLASSLDILVNENWQGASVTQLVRTQLSHWRDVIGTRITLEGEDIVLEPEAAQNIGLALHELSTNSAKYGALSVPSGVIAISWRLDASGETPRFIFDWAERNGPAVQPPRHKGFGHAVIERLVPRALNGKAQLDYAESGFSWRLDIPSSYIRDPGAEPSEPKVWVG